MRNIKVVPSASYTAASLGAAVRWAKKIAKSDFMGSKSIVEQIEGRDILFIIKATEMAVRVVFIDNTALFVYKDPNREKISALTYDNDKWTLEKSFNKQSTYGNVDWKGENNEVLCWKGVASRHFKFEPMIPIDGYLTYDEDVTIVVGGLPLEVPYYTPFSNNIYYRGGILQTIPNGSAPHYIDNVLQKSKTSKTLTNPKVVSCAFLLTNEAEPDSKKLIAIVNTNYKNVINPDGQEAGGFFDEIWIDGARHAYFRSSRPYVNWFFNSTGTEAQCVIDGIIKKLTVLFKTDTTGIKYSFVYETRDACSGHIAEAFEATTTPVAESGTNPGDWETGVPSDYTAQNGEMFGGFETMKRIQANVTQQCIVAIDYKGTKEVIATATQTLSDLSLYNNIQYSFSWWLENIPYDGITPLSLYGPDVWTTYTTDYGVDGGCSPYTITPPTETCGTGTLIVTDNAGNTATKSVRMASGTWVFSYAVTPATGGSPDHTYIHYSGNTRTIYGYNVLCKPTVATTDPCYVPPSLYAFTLPYEYSTDCIYTAGVGSCHDLAGKIELIRVYENVYIWECP
jgi:hypothetical protein